MQEPLVLFEPGPATAAPAPIFAPTARRRGRAPAPLAPELRPRERLRAVGPENLSGADLLGILLGGGTDEKGAVELAGEIISEAGGILGLRSASYHDLLPGFGAASLDEADACVVLAAVELAKRLGPARKPGRPVVVSSPDDVHAFLGDRMRDLDRENFVVVLLDTKNGVIGCPTVSVGTLSSSLVHPREVFKPAIRASAASVILVHNHPSGNVSPSREDQGVTRKLSQAGETIGIEVLDHVIVGDGFHSMKEHGTL